jgi:2'-5' RNA ligase
MAPLVVSLLLAAEAQARFDAERARLFPASPVGAHVTLFHALPPDLDVVGALTEVAARPAFDVLVGAVMPLGRGVAYRLVSPELSAVHATLRARFADRLTPQDRQPYRPHLTVQNKVPPEESRRTLAALRAGFQPHQVAATGLALWRYDGGPWAPLSRHPFRPEREY